MNYKGVCSDDDIIIGDHKSHPDKFVCAIVVVPVVCFEKHAVFTDIDDETEFRIIKLASGGINFNGHMVKTDSRVSAAFIRHHENKIINGKPMECNYLVVVADCSARIGNDW